jgi:hypothetical protein
VVYCSKKNSHASGKSSRLACRFYGLGARLLHNGRRRRRRCVFGLCVPLLK